jgi:hypothetical protein
MEHEHPVRATEAVITSDSLNAAAGDRQMSAIRGHVRNGVVVLDNGVNLPEGTAVRVEAIESSAQASSLADQLLQWAGKGVNLPPDLARRHDHYLHGQDDS